MDKKFELIDQIVLNLFKDIKDFSFPYDPANLTLLFDNVRFLSYTDLAKQAKTSIETIIKANFSSTGASYYDKENNRFICMFNDTPDIPLSRQYWTKTHEFGHVILGHHQVIGKSLITESLSDEIYEKFEEEANYFASQFIAPYCMYQPMKIHSPVDIKNKFSVSTVTAFKCIQGYLEYKKQPLNATQREMRRVLSEKLGLKKRKKRNGI